VPGRIEFLGKHTDYAGGRSLLCAVERGFAVVSVPRDDRGVRIHDAISGASARSTLSTDIRPPRGQWPNYPLTVCARVARNFPGNLRGLELAFASDLPSAAGLSSSSVLIIATWLALAEANALRSRPEYLGSIHRIEDLAGYLGAVENGSTFGQLSGGHGVGTLGGSQDHTAILASFPGALVQYAFAPVRFERKLPLPNDHVFVVAASGVVAAKGGRAQEQYNQAATRAAVALRVWRDETGSDAPTLAAALTESPNMSEELRSAISRRSDLPFSAEALVARVQQLSAELEIIDGAANAIAAGDLARLGALIDRSQANAERLLGNQVPETIALARSARELGAAAASAFGAGFGGSVYALVTRRSAKEFLEQWRGRYVKEFPARAAGARFFVTCAGPPATQLTTSS
jgi:galactokinase